MVLFIYYKSVSAFGFNYNIEIIFILKIINLIN